MKRTNIFLVILMVFLVQGNAQSLTGTSRFKYHGYFYKNENLEYKELKEIREFANMLVFSMVRFDSLTTEMIRDIADGNIDKFAPSVFDEMNRRIELLESLDYVTVAEAPFYPLIRFDKFDNYKRTLRTLKERVPWIDSLDYFYFWDEPDLNHVPGPEVMEKYIAEFKNVFPAVKVTTCYAIINEESLDVVPPDNYDLLMVDPYVLMNEASEHAAADFERFYRSRLALALEWVNKWDRPFLMVGDAFGSLSGEGKGFPTPEVSLWYYMIALTQPKCTGLLWFQYGYMKTAENITGVTIDGPPQDIMKVHREIAGSIFGKPSPLGLPWAISEDPPVPEIVKEAMKPGLINDFIIMAYSGPPLEEVTLERYQEIADAGIEYLVPGNGTFNLEQNLKALDLAEQVGIGIIPVDMRLIPFALKPDVSIDTAVIKQMARDYKDHPAFEGYFVKDEPNISMYSSLKEIADVFHAVDPDNESLSCLFPNYGTLTQFGVEDYGAYITSFIEIVKPGLLSYDSYVMRHDVTLYEEWFSNLALVREETRKADIPFLVFIQSHGVEEGLRVPDRAEILWQVNTVLSYGARGVGWLSYWTPNPGLGVPHVEGAAPPMMEHFHNGPIDIHGNRTEMYDYVREANLYLKKAGKGLLGWDNTDVARYEDGLMIREGSSPVVSLEGVEANIVIGTYRKDNRARLVISNASCDEPTSFALNLDPGYESAEVFASIDADPSGQNESLLEWAIKPGGSVVIEVKKTQ